MNINATNSYANSGHSYNIININKKRNISINRISTGSKISSSFEDPSGVGILSKIRSQKAQTSSLRKNLNNALSYLETQADAMRILEKIVNRIDEINLLKKDSIINSQTSAGYNSELNNLNANIKTIREETFNGIRLFSPNEQTDSINAQTFQIDGTSLEFLRPPLPFDPEPLEIVFLIDFSGSMSSYWNDVKNNIDIFINQLNSDPNIPDWKAKVVGYPANSSFANGLGNAFVDNASGIRAQIDAMPRWSYGQGEPLIEALDATVNNAGWSISGTKKGIIAITDEPITESVYALNNRSRVANNLQDFNFTLLTEGYSGGSSGDPRYNYLTDDLINNSGGIMQDLTSSFANPTALFTGLADRLSTPDVPFDSNILSSYVVQNAVDQSILQNKLKSLDSIEFNLVNVDRLTGDTDIAKESLSLINGNFLEDINLNIIKKYNYYQNSYTGLILNKAI